MSIDTMGWFRVFYLLAGAVIVGVELWAVFDRHPGNTISESVWWLQETQVGKFVRWMICAFLLWLLVHFATNGKWIA